MNSCREDPNGEKSSITLINDDRRRVESYSDSNSLTQSKVIRSVVVVVRNVDESFDRDDDRVSCLF